MKIQQLSEMAAKKICPDCGKTMAANHYWYKGGWRCKKNKEQQPAPTATPAPGPTPVPAVPAATPAPAPTSAKKITLEEIKALIPELGREIYGDMIDWQVYEYKGTINVSWDYTFRRNTSEGAFNSNRQRIAAANARIKQIADKYAANVTKVHYVTADTARERDEWSLSNGDSAYSEYEQSLGGGVSITP
jgi:hypothetical protein